MQTGITGQVEINIKATISKVWDALTNPAIIKRYFFGTDTTTDWQPGSAVTFTGEWQGKTYKDKGEVLSNEKEKLLKYTYWSSMSGLEDKPENYAIVTYQLSGADGNVDLIVTQENIPDEKTKAHSLENWKKVVEGLKAIVEKNP